MTTYAASRTAWFQQLALIAITVVLILQNTKHALLPSKQTPVLWGAELAVICGVLILRSGWMRDARWRDEQRRLGTLANDFYEPRREALVNGCAVGGGVLGALWWAAATWGVVLTGMRRGVVTRGLFDFEVAALVGAITGSIVGAVVGLVAGQLWETRHRKNRIARRASHG
ncbi:MAG TPA: hypothetical protein VKP00_02390 [Gemmatimonadaceae bacterium]|nr:hypothetical protein [Gemmatimonadaceae bacterium]